MENRIEQDASDASRSGEHLFTGVGIGGGMACGKLHFLHAPTNQTKEETGKGKSPLPRRPEDAEREWNRILDAKECAEAQIDAIRRTTEEKIGAEEAQIFEIHELLLGDADLADAMKRAVFAGASAETAVEEAVEEFARMIRDLKDPYLSGRSADIRDVGARLTRILSGSPAVADSTEENREPYLLVADDLTPSETVSLDRKRILGFITFSGTENSHTAILARAMGIPALVGVGAIPSSFNGKKALLNAREGSLRVDPSKESEKDFLRALERRREAERSKEAYLRSRLNVPARSGSGHTVLVYANIGSPDDVPAALAGGAEGIGLLRSEFLYLSLSDYPTEDMLFSAYRSVVRGMAGRRVVIRTLDVGADKRIPYFGLTDEENPAMGYRGIRICLDREALFKTQLRALLRASAYGRMAIMVPMVVSADEVIRTRKLLNLCRDELILEGKDVSPTVEFGIMIETPAAALMSRELAREVDFFSIGTNDLSSYTLAADRQNPAVMHLCRENPEPILRLSRMAADAIHEEGGWIGVCGEMAADTDLTQRWVDIKIDELSVSPPFLLGLREGILKCH